MTHSDTKDIDEELAHILDHETYRTYVKPLTDLFATQKEQLLDRIDGAIGEDEDKNLTSDLEESVYLIPARNELRTQLRAVLTKEREK